MRMEIGVKIGGAERILREVDEHRNNWDGGVDYVPVEGPWAKVLEKEVWEALKMM